MEKPGNKFFEYVVKMDIGNFEFVPETNIKEFVFNQTEIEFLINEGLVFDGTEGGFIKGISHEKGGIHLIAAFPGNRYLYGKQVEGGDYLISNDAYLKNKKELNKIIQVRNFPPVNNDPEIINFSKIIDTKNKMFSFILISGQQFVVNKINAQIFYRKIIEIERKSILKIED